MPDTADRSAPTIVVARRPVPGREREFERWLRRLALAAGRAPGHVGSDVQPPGEAHPDEWMIVYQFSDGEALDAWLTSDVRRELLEAGDGLVDGPEREQLVALNPQTESVTAVASFVVVDGRAADAHAVVAGLVAEMERFPGYLRSELLPPVEGVQREHVFTFSFDSREHLDDWLDSDERRIAVAHLDELIEGRRTINVVGSFGGWFGRPGQVEVKRWKQASVVLLALFPTSLVLTVLREWLLPDLPLAGAVLFGNALGVVVLSWLLMPWLTRVLDGWLRR